MLKSKTIINDSEICIFSNPFRKNILLLFDPNLEPLTVKQMSDSLGESPSKVHYHVKALERIGILEIVETKEKKGIIEKYYLPTAENFIIQKSIRTPAAANQEDTPDDILEQKIDTSTKVTETTGDTADINAASSELPNQLTGYLTSAEIKELQDMFANFIKNKTKGEGTDLFQCTLLTPKDHK